MLHNFTQCLKDYICCNTVAGSVWEHEMAACVDFMLVEVYLYWNFIIYSYLFIFVSYLGSMMPPCRYTQSSIKELILKVVKYP